LTLAIDAMGGDFGPCVTVPAALQALASHSELFLLLVGNPDTLMPLLAKADSSLTGRLQVIPAESVIASDARPAQAIRNSRGSSMRVALEMVKEGRAQACISAGNTGALMGLSTLLLKPFGVIEGLRALRPEARFLELVHRLDRDTSGILLVAKKRSALRSLHEQLREKGMQKDYLALVRGNWPSHLKVVQAPLLKNILQSGERVVRVSSEGKASETRFKVEERFDFATLVKASPVTGRTHQIRVHTLHAGHPIAFDDRYGERDFDSQLASTGLKRLFLHAAALTFTHPGTGEVMRVEAPLDDGLKQCLNKLRQMKA